MLVINEPRNQPPTSNKEGGSTEKPQEGRGAADWLRRAQNAYEFSTAFTDTNYRQVWEDSIRAFNNQHPSGSKYTHPAYEKRSRLFRPRVRTVIRKNEAAAAAAFFSNLDVVSITAANQSDKMQEASAEVMKQLLQFRLTKSIPWFQTVLGGLQDAQNQGVVCGHVYWDYRPARATVELDVAMDDQGPMSMHSAATKTPAVDKPAIELIPAENIRIDPSASWIDPINTSPYVIHLIPMYVMEVRERMRRGEWNTVGEGTIRTAVESKADTTRLTRNLDREDPAKASRPVSDYEVVWVQRHIHRYQDEDWEFYTLGTLLLLNDPVPLRKVVLHGIRPYVMGLCILETHKLYPSTIYQLAKGLQDESNEIVNQRMDNVKLVLNKKFIAKRGKDVDLAGLVRNVPGGVVMANDPETDIKEMNWPDVTASAYQEQQRVDFDFNELLGNFSPAAMVADHALNAPARNMSILNQSAGTLVEYLLRTYVETFVQPALRQLVMLEQQYETDKNVIALAAQKAQLVQRFGIDNVTDELLENEVTLTVNVGMGATDPSLKLQKFITAMSSFTAMMQKPAPGVNMQEVGKEIFGHLGYNDGSRFFTNENPQVPQLQMQLKQAMMMIQQLQMKLKEKQTGHLVKMQSSRESDATKLAATRIKEAGADRRALANHFRAIMSEANTAQREVGRGKVLSNTPAERSQ